MIAIALLGYTPSVLAADVWLGPLDIPMMKYLYVCWMASWGASAAFLQKYAAGEIEKTWGNVILHAAKDLVNSNLAAVLVFLACQHYGVPKSIEAICYTLGGYGGARTLEAAYKKFISTGNGIVNKATGIADDSPQYQPAQNYEAPVQPPPGT